jgi:putative CocE/NonD family hydrolase
MERIPSTTPSGSPAVYNVTVDITLRIPTRSGVTLGATIARPNTTEPVPVLVTYHPYRGAWEGTVGYDARYYAERGYAFVYLHARGSGNSEGASVDEYTAEETADGYDAVEWLAAQNWCNGSVGMLGASYSGFTALQVAALAPPTLKAIAPAYFTDRRYTDDCHYKGGCLRGYYDTLTYGLSMVAMNALPPYPLAVGDAWADMWRRRLEESEPYLLKWIEHPVEDDYWAQGSVIGRYDQIRAASFLIGGWNDGYPNPPLRTFQALTVPKKLLVGPWSHTYPDRSHCGPRIDIYFELLRWWDRWLKGIENGVEKEPKVQIYAREFEPPVQDRTLIAGAWFVGDDLPAGAATTWNLGDGELSPNPSSPSRSGEGELTEVDRFEYLPAASVNGGLWDGGSAYCLPGDQRPDEARAVNYTSAPLAEDLLIFGRPNVSLVISADVPVLPLAARLCDVGPDGTSVLVTKGILNLTRVDGMDAPRPLVPGEPVHVTLDLEATCWRFRAGHRVRLSVNGSDFPNIWPTPFRGEGRIHRGAGHEARLSLPLWPEARPAGDPFLPSPHPPASTGSGGDPPPWRIVHDVLEQRTHYVMSSGNEFVVSNRNPALAYTRARNTLSASWEGFTARAEASVALASDERSFHLTITLNVSVNDVPHFQRRWHRSVARRLM